MNVQDENELFERTPATIKADSAFEFEDPVLAIKKLEQLPPAPRAFLDNLLRLNLVSLSLAGQFVEDHATRLSEVNSAETLAEILIQEGLMTKYQFSRIRSGATHGLVLGHYRVLEQLGAGGMGVVFVGEHLMMQRKVAIKVMPVDDDCPAPLIRRFYTEMRVLAKLQHPNIVTAHDSGRVEPANGRPLLLYLVMELIEGCDLEQYVRRNGPVRIDTACRWIRQAAEGLQEAHNNNLVHRDVKPSNLLVTRDQQIKLVDFGLVRQFANSMTDPKATLGTLDYMPPEQGVDPSSVGTHADIYSLGATLFWLLTGQTPYPRKLSTMAALKQLKEQPPQRLRSLLPSAPPELDAFLARLLDRDPMRRPPMALSVVKYLEPFAAM